MQLLGRFPVVMMEQLEPGIQAEYAVAVALYRGRKLHVLQILHAVEAMAADAGYTVFDHYVPDLPDAVIPRGFLRRFPIRDSSIPGNSQRQVAGEAFGLPFNIRIRDGPSFLDMQSCANQSFVGVIEHFNMDFLIILRKTTIINISQICTVHKSCTGYKGDAFRNNDPFEFGALAEASYTIDSVGILHFFNPGPGKSAGTYISDRPGKGDAC